MEVDRYPIVLSDALLGKPTNEVYTGIRYNHKAGNSSCSSSDPYRLKPSNEDPENYKLSFSANSESFTYEGERITHQGRYVLIFDPVKEHFVLHRIDSNFDMKLVGAPWLQNTLNQRPRQSQAASKAPPKRRAPRDSALMPSIKVDTQRQSVEKPKKQTIARREPTPDEEDGEEESDNGLTIEYPDRPNGQESHQYDLALIFQSQKSENVNDENDDDDDDDHTAIDSDDLELTSDKDKTSSQLEDGSTEICDDEMQMALEAELEQELLKESAADVAEESDESEEE